MDQRQPQVNCIRLKFQAGDRVTHLLGRIINDSDGFVEFETARRRYTINRVLILSIEETSIPFRSEAVSC